MTVEDGTLPVIGEAGGRWRFDLVLPLFIRPRATLGRIAAYSDAVWQVPILLLSVAAVARSLVSGWLNAASQGGDVALPPGFEYYTPEQMAQFQQAATATNNPTFNYILPALGALAGIVAAWLILGWLLHLVLTLLGGRGSSQATINVVAWAALPLLLRFSIQIVAMLVTRTDIAAPGLSGFAPADTGFVTALVGSVLSQIDIYLVWQIVLLVIGMRLVSQLPAGKCWLAVLAVLLLVMALRALPAALLAQFGDLTVIQPFF